MSDYTPKPEHKFTFGLWTVGSVGRDPFGGRVRESKYPADLVHLLGEVGAGVWENDLTACEAFVRADGITRPDLGQAVAYRKAYPQFRQLYPTLKSSFAKMS